MNPEHRSIKGLIIVAWKDRFPLGNYPMLTNIHHRLYEASRFNPPSPQSPSPMQSLTRVPGLYPESLSHLVCKSLLVSLPINRDHSRYIAP